MTTDPIFWLLAIIGIVITGISKSGFAGGAGVVAVPLLSFKVGVLEATAITLPLLLVMDAQTLRYYWHAINWQELRGLIPGAASGIVIGGLTMGYFSDGALLLALGILSLTFALWGPLQHLIAQARGARLLWSCASGFTSTLVHAGGPPLNIYLIARRLPKLSWLATAGAFFAFMNALKLIPYTVNEQWNLETLAISIVLIPIAFIGVWIGKQIQGILSETSFMFACKGLLLLSGVALIVKGL